MTIKWGDPIECNGVRPDWLRDVADPRSVQARNNWDEWLDIGSNAPLDRWSWSHVAAIRLPADHPAYIALARGFHPWSGGESAPDDWDATQPVLFRDLSEETAGSWTWSVYSDTHPRDIIGYRKRVEYGAVHADGSRSGGQPAGDRFDEPHLARIEVEGSVPILGVFMKRMTEAEARDWIMNHTYTESEAHILHALGQLGLVESRAERFTRETGHAVTEAVEAALNWKEI